MNAEQVARFPISHWRAAEQRARRPELAADALTRHDSIIALAAWLAVLTDEVVALGGNRAGMVGAARNLLETLGVDAEHGGAAEAMKLMRGE